MIILDLLMKTKANKNYSDCAFCIPYVFQSWGGNYHYVFGNVATLKHSNTHQRHTF